MIYKKLKHFNLTNVLMTIFKIIIESFKTHHMLKLIIVYKTIEHSHIKSNKKWSKNVL